MAPPILATKLYVPSRRAKVVLRSRLDERLNEGLGRRLTLVSAPAGFGKSTLVAEWIARCALPVAWLSLDEGDGHPNRFLTYLVAALRNVAPGAGEGVLAMLDSPRPPPLESTLTLLLNELAALPDTLVLVLDDYHSVDSQAVDDAVAFLLEHLPPRMHVVIATREDPALPLARMRARAELTEVRASDLRFTPEESAAFLGQVMGLDLSSSDVEALDATTEGWIAGLQLAAISLQGHDDAAGFIRSFSGSHRFVLDYLVEEVLGRQPPAIRDFLLRTSILDRLCGPLCDAVAPDPARPGQETLEQLDRANLFLVALDGERRWYRYHHLFRDLLRQRLTQAEPVASVDEIHDRASRWCEANNLDLDAFRHAAAGHDAEHAERLITGRAPSLQGRGAISSAEDWLLSLPAGALDARPSLRLSYADVLVDTGRTRGVEAMLAAAESALDTRPQDELTRPLLAWIARIRALLAFLEHRPDDMTVASERALELLPADSSTRAFAAWAAGSARESRGERAAARQAYGEALSMSRAAGYRLGEMAASLGIAGIHEIDTELRLAAATYEDTIRLAADLPFPWISDAHLGLARIRYEWNDLGAASASGETSLGLARQIQDNDRPVACLVLLARVRLAQGDAAEAARLLAEADAWVNEHDFARAAPSVADARAMLALRGGDVDAATRLADAFDLPLVRARACLAGGDAEGALAALEPARREAEVRAWPDARLRALILQSLAQRAAGDPRAALSLLEEAMRMAEPRGFVRLFVDEGPLMASLLREAAEQGLRRESCLRLLAGFAADSPEGCPGAEASRGARPADASGLVEPLSRRELELLELIAEGLGNQDIADRLYVSLHTVKTHARNIYAKLGVGSRTQAAARARALGLLSAERPPDERAARD
jgi:LuxR family transcriptional regulator, maltose regulon positive regulatory protein